MNPLDRRLSRLEAPSSQEPAHEDWLAVLDADDPTEALAAFEERFPIVKTARHKSALDKLA